ncbi:MAG: DUF1146 family protein [Bacilli bacterium]
MNIKLILYVITIPFSLWIITSMRLEQFFKKGSVMQIHCLSFTLSLILSYMLVGFLLDMFTTARFF